MTSTEWVKGSRLVKVMDDWAEHLHLGLHRTSRRCLFLQGSVMGRRWRVKEKSGVWLTFFSFLAHCFVGCPASFTYLFFRYSLHTTTFLYFPGGTSGKELSANAGDTRDAGSILGQEDPLEKGMATHSSILAWRNPWTEEPGGLQSMGSQRVRHDWSSWAHMHPNIYLFKVYNWMIFNIFTRVCDHHCLVWFTFLNDSSGCCVDGMEWGEEAPSGKPNGSWTKAAVVMGEHRCFWGFQFSKLDTCISYEAGQPDFGSAPFYLP